MIIDKPRYGYNINTGEPITEYEDRLVYVGGGEYMKASEVTKEFIDRRKKWLSSIDVDLKSTFFLAGQEEY